MKRKIFCSILSTGIFSAKTSEGELEKQIDLHLDRLLLLLKLKG